ncbi:hypothetical protein RJ641_021040 [Dillenia turbinata]|uniref:Methyltransferase type 11 domain-containing protein n=1 Tax=Dillenia turbinata TaxID=194707 RepID=A0AAN8UGQ6_9MAGN
MADLFHKQAKHYAVARPNYPSELFQFIASMAPNNSLAWDVGTGSDQAAQSINDSVNLLMHRLYFVNMKPFGDPAPKLVADEYKSLEFPFHLVGWLDHTGPFQFKSVKMMDLEDIMVLIRSSSAYQTAKDNGFELSSENEIENLGAWKEDGDGQKAGEFLVHLRIGKAKHYKVARPSYPQELFQFIASKTPAHTLAWDVGTGSGQAAQSDVIATDASQEQLDFAPKLPNIKYACTPPNMSMHELKGVIESQESVDVVTIAQALHWFDLPNFYQQVKWSLKKPHGVIAAWCYIVPRINTSVDSLVSQFYFVDMKPYKNLGNQLVADEYKTLEFPFEPVEGYDHTGPFSFKSVTMMSLEDMFSLMRSWSAYQVAKDRGVELLSEKLIAELQSAWKEDGNGLKVVEFPLFLKIGKVGKLA